MQQTITKVTFNEAFCLMIGQTEGLTISVKGNCEMIDYHGTGEPDDESDTTFHFSNVMYCINEVHAETMQRRFEDSLLDWDENAANAVNVWVAIPTDFEEEFAYTKGNEHLKGFIDQVKSACINAAIKNS
jgi:hypothetical protein